MFGKEGSNITVADEAGAKFNLIIELAKYIRDLSENFFQSNYKVERLAVYKADLRFLDYSLNEVFEARAFPLSIYADSIYKKSERVDVLLTAGLIPQGDLSVALSIDPHNSGNFDLNYHLNDVPLATANPYLVSFTSFPMENGTLRLNGIWNVRNGMIESRNHLLLVDPKLANRIKNKGNGWIPLPLVLACIKERGNVIDYEIPIEGDLKDPSFILKDVVGDLFVNLFLKPSSLPFLIHSENVETEIETAFIMKWEMGQSLPDNSQEKFLSRLQKYLEDNPEANITITPVHYEVKEKERILFFEAKKKYFLQVRNPASLTFDFADSMKISKTAIKEPGFVNYIEKQYKDSLIYTIQEKCEAYLGNKIVLEKFEKLVQMRKSEIVNALQSKSSANQVIFKTDINTIPPNGFSYFKIGYKGMLPERLISAYDQMNEINERDFRKKYEKVRSIN